MGTSASDSVPEGLLGQDVIVDVRSPYVMIGRLAGVHLGWLELRDADVHDLRDSSTTRELYVLDAARHGVKRNRHRAWVRLDEVVCLARLSDFSED